jgi:hypothetical protein
MNVKLATHRLALAATGWGVSLAAALSLSACELVVSLDPALADAGVSDAIVCPICADVSVDAGYGVDGRTPDGDATDDVAEARDATLEQDATAKSDGGD